MHQFVNKKNFDDVKMHGMYTKIELVCWNVLAEDGRSLRKH
jgi:hypothetical protein